MDAFTIHVTSHKEVSQAADYASIKVDICATSSSCDRAIERASQAATQASALCHELVCRDLTERHQTSAHAIKQTPVTSTEVVAAASIAGDSTNSTKSKAFLGATSIYFRLKDYTSFRPYLDRLLQLPAFDSVRINWVLLPATRCTVGSGLRIEAASEALQKAREYCSVFYLEDGFDTHIRPVELIESTTPAEHPDDLVFEHV